MKESENKFIIEIKNPNGENITISISENATIWDWGRIFRIILNFATFSNKLIEELIKKDEEYE